MERDIEYHDSLEYYAALAPWATFNVNRSKDSPMMDPLDFMARRKHRLAYQGEPEQPKRPAPMQGRPAILLAPVPTTGKRYAVKGERPASRFAPGQSDGVIERFDAYTVAAGRGRNGR